MCIFTGITAIEFAANHYPYIYYVVNVAITTFNYTSICSIFIIKLIITTMGGQKAWSHLDYFLYIYIYIYFEAWTKEHKAQPSTHLIQVGPGRSKRRANRRNNFFEEGARRRIVRRSWEVLLNEPRVLIRGRQQ